MFLNNNEMFNIVTNPVHALPFIDHQRSLAHHIDSCTTQTVAHHLKIQFPSSICTEDTQLSPISHCLITLITQLIALITRLTMDFLSHIAEYCLAFITLQEIATLRSPRSCHSLSLCVFDSYPVFPGLTLCLAIRTLFAPLLDYCLRIWIISLPCPVGYCSPIVDPRFP